MFRRLWDRINRFMYGRYGADALFYTLFIASCVCTLLDRFLPFLFLWIPGSLLLLLSVCRYLSKNLYKRREENRKFLAAFAAVRSWFRFQRDRLRDISVCRYRKCRYCRAACRLPIKRGKHTVRCPKCGRRFNVFILF